MGKRRVNKDKLVGLTAWQHAFIHTWGWFYSFKAKLEFNLKNLKAATNKCIFYPKDNGGDA